MGGASLGYGSAGTFDGRDDRLGGAHAVDAQGDPAGAVDIGHEPTRSLPTLTGPHLYTTRAGEDEELRVREREYGDRVVGDVPLLLPEVPPLRHIGSESQSQGPGGPYSFQTVSADLQLAGDFETGDGRGYACRQNELGGGSVAEEVVLGLG